MTYDPLLDGPRPTDCFRVLHTAGGESCCLWFRTWDRAGQFTCYREWFPVGIGPQAFADGILKKTPETEELRRGDMQGFCDETLAGDNSPHSLWRAAGVYCSRVTLPKDWGSLVGMLEQVEVPCKGGGYEIAPRLSAMTLDCERVYQVCQTLPKTGDPGDLLTATALLVACLSRPVGFADVRDPAAEREAKRNREVLREFGPKAYEARTGKKAPRGYR